MHELSRRSLFAAGSLTFPLFAASQGGGGQQVPLPPFKADTEQQTGPPPAPTPPDERVGFALVGMGNLSVDQLLPAFGECKKAKVTALVSGDANKAKILARQYGIPESSVYGYGDYARLGQNRDVQVAYIVLPNGLHRDHTVRAFENGKHVLCEKPMANSSRECEDMIAAAKKAQRKLMVAYRIQYEPNNRHVREVVRSGKYGPVKLIEMANVQRQGAPDQWRHKRALAGGGSLPDIGLYCLNTSRFLLGEEPAEVFATEYTTPNDPRFREVEENIVVQMRFPSGVLVNFITGYDSHDSRRYRVHSPLGWIGMDPAFSYSGLKMEQAHAEKDIELRAQPAMKEKNQFALEIDHFASCVKENKDPFTPGEEGLQDHRIMEAIYESAKSRKPVSLPQVDKRDAFRGTEPVTS
jgi:predicted dehydrogenase